MPPKIANAPELLIGNSLYYFAFFDLTTCRTMGGTAEGPISWLAIDEYCKRQQITGDQREDMLYHIQQMDAAYIKYKIGKIEASYKSAAKGK